MLGKFKLLMALTCLIFNSTVAGAAIDKSADAAIREQAKTYEAAFARGDAKAIADLWTEQGTLVDPRGDIRVGRAEIAQTYVEHFKGMAFRTLDIQIKSLESPVPGTVIERGVTTLLDDKKQPIFSAPYTAVHQLTNGRWLISQVVESAPAAARTSLGDLQWLVGQWQSGDGVMTMTNNLIGNGKLLLTTFEKSGGAAGSSESDFMVTAENAKTGRLTSSLFDSKGGTGQGVWHRLPDGSWAFQWHRSTGTGAAVSATHLMAPVDGNGFKWRTTGRTVNREHLADIPETLVTRKK